MKIIYKNGRISRQCGTMEERAFLYFRVKSMEPMERSDCKPITSRVSNDCSQMDTVYLEQEKSCENPGKGN